MVRLKVIAVTGKWWFRGDNLNLVLAILQSTGCQFLEMLLNVVLEHTEN